MIEPITMPFMVGAMVNNQINKARIIEACIIAGLTAAATSFITVGKIEVKLEEREKQRLAQIQHRDAEVKAIKDDADKMNIKRDAQYENLRAELQKIALIIERGKI